MIDFWIFPLSTIWGAYQNKGIPGQNYDKNIFHLPRHSSFMIMHIFVDWGNTGQNMVESLGITTVSTTKAHERNRDKCKRVGRNP